MQVNIKDKKVIITFAVIVCIIISGFLFTKGEKETANSSQQFEEITVKKGDIKIDMVSDGVVEFSTINLQFQINGVLEEVFVKEGQHVQKGDPIARLDAGKYESELEIAKANYTAAQAKLEKVREQRKQQLLTEKSKLENSKTQLENLELQYKPMQEVPEDFTQQEIESKKLALESARKEYQTALESYQALEKSTADVKEAEAAVAQAKAALQKAERNLDDTILKAPLDGTVLEIAGKVGEAVSGNSESGKTFAIIGEKDKVQVIATVLELDIGEVFEGQKVEVQLEAYPEKTYLGKVTKIAAIPTVDSSGIVAYEVEIELQDPDGDLKSGMTCTAAFIIKEKEDVVMIPNKAVKMVNDKQVVEVITKEGKQVEKEIKTGFTDGYNVEITEGLEPGEKVMISKKASN